MEKKRKRRFTLAIVVVGFVVGYGACALDYRADCAEAESKIMERADEKSRDYNEARLAGMLVSYDDLLNGARARLCNVWFSFPHIDLAPFDRYPRP